MFFLRISNPPRYRSVLFPSFTLSHHIIFLQFAIGLSDAFDFHESNLTSDLICVTNSFQYKKIYYLYWVTCGCRSKKWWFGNGSKRLWRKCLRTALASSSERARPTTCTRACPEVECALPAAGDRSSTSRMSHSGLTAARATLRCRHPGYEKVEKDIIKRGAISPWHFLIWNFKMWKTTILGSFS